MAFLPPTATAIVASARATSSKITLEAFAQPSPANRLPPIRTLSTSSSTSSRPGSARRAFFSTTSCLKQKTTHQDAAVPTAVSVSDQIRSLMRESAQPVALVTALLPPTPPPSSDSVGQPHDVVANGEERLIHGATLSSFTSISLDPNLVCFSMKTPSKLADALSYHLSNRSHSSSSPTTPTTSRDREQTEEEEAEEGVDFVVNILSDSQASLAATYSVPGTPPLPYRPSAHHTRIEMSASHPLVQAGLFLPPPPPSSSSTTTTTRVGRNVVPILKDAVGAFGCQVVDTIDLSRYDGNPTHDARNEVGQVKNKSKSVLYIAKIVHVYVDGQRSNQTAKDESEKTETEPSMMTMKQPLIYHRQNFVSTSNIPLPLPLT